MWTSANIRKFINVLPKGVIFSTRQLLNYGTRAAVDQCLCRLVKNGDIRRLAWGLFMRDDPSVPRPSTQAVATEKAKAFGKQILADGADAARFVGSVTRGNQRTTYAISGRSSSFKYKDVRIYFKGISARKMSLGDSPLGLAIRGLWQLGKDNCRFKNITLAVGSLNGPARQQFMQSRHVMPAWMTNLLTKMD
jgi:Family of unknown function (DUF6088)